MHTAELKRLSALLPKVIIPSLSKTKRTLTLLPHLKANTADRAIHGKKMVGPRPFEP